MSSKQTYAAFRRLLEKQSEALAKAFDTAVRDITSSAQQAALEDAIKAGDIARVWVVLHLDQRFWAPLDRAIQQAYVEGALHQISDIPKRLPGGAPGLVIRFDETNPRAVRASQKYAADLVQQVNDDTIRLINNVITEGAKSSVPPRDLAVRLIGKKVGNKRVGGLIGLTSQQADYVQSARTELSDPERMRNYLTRQRRDRRFDAAVERAIKEGRPVPASMIDKITMRYADRLLQLRGETISRTETLRALNAGKIEAVNQMVDTGDVPQTAVELEWVSDPRLHHRDGHWLMNRDRVAHGGKFENPLTGERLAYPGDPDAPASEVVNCKCFVRSVVDYVAVAKARGSF